MSAAAAEWQDKVDHRNRYIRYIRDSRIHRVREVRKRVLGEDGIEIDYSKSNLHEDFRLIDRETGLKAPEPTECLKIKTLAPPKLPLPPLIRLSRPWDDDEEDDTWEIPSISAPSTPTDSAGVSRHQSVSDMHAIETSHKGAESDAGDQNNQKLNAAPQNTFSGVVPQDIVVDVQGGDISKGTALGSYSTKRITVSNKGTVSAQVAIDFRGKSEFGVKAREAPASARKASSSRSRGPSGRHRRVKDINDASNNVTKVTKVERGHPDLTVYRLKPEPDLGDGSIFLIDVSANETVPLDITFKPTAVGKHCFDALVYVPNSAEPILISVEAEAHPSPMAVSKTEVNFKYRVVHRDTGEGVSHLRSVAKDQLVLTNTSKRSTEWWFDVELLEDSKVFKMEPWRGVLAQGESQTVTVTFQPEATGAYEALIPLFLDSLAPKPLRQIPIRGTGVEPNLAFYPPEIYLPITKAGEEVSAIFSVINYGCERTEIKATIPDELADVLELHFPEGQLLKSDGEKLTVQVQYKSKPVKPLSFTAKVAFSYDGRRPFFLPIYGTSDTSLLTLTTYYWLAEVEEKPTETLTVNQKRSRLLNDPRPVRTPSGLPLEHGVSVGSINDFLTEQGNTLLRWLETHIPGNAPTSFPTILINAGAKGLQSLITSLTGKKVPISSPPLSTAGFLDEERRRAAILQFGEILAYLRSAGALLSAVKPEHLLPASDFRAFLANKKNDPALAMHEEQEGYTRKIEANFETISNDAWCRVLSQIVRVFVASTVTMRQFRALPGVNKDEANMSWQPLAKSGTQSACESALLRWTSYAAWKSSMREQHFTDFATDFETLAPFAQLLMAHLPNMANTHFASWDAPGEEASQALNRASLVAQAFQDLLPGCPALPQGIEHLVNKGPDRLETFLLVLFLYQTLPSFVPKALIEFKGALHARIIQEIEIFNPTTRSVTYVPELQGPSEFKLHEQNATVFLPAKSSIKLPVSFVSRFFRPVTGSLVLRSRNMGLNNTSVLVFELVSEVEEAAPTKVANMLAPMYATPATVLNLEVQNPFDSTGRFKITLQESKSNRQFTPASFAVSQSELELKASETRTLQVAFIPFELGAHTCLIHFLDHATGEFTYQVDGFGVAPHPTETLVWTAKAGNSMEKAIRVMPGNPSRDKAITAALSGMQNAFKGPSVEYSSSHFRGPAEVVIRPAPEVPKQKADLPWLDESYTEVPITFRPQNAGKYSCRIILTCLDAPDVRIIVVNALAISEGSRATLELSVPARQKVTQDIPIVNRTADDWTIKANVSGDRCFTGPFTVVARAFTTTPYPVAFLPTKPGESNGQLTLTNLQTAQKYVYTLRGIGLNPMPEGTKEFSCRAREATSLRFPVTNQGDTAAEYAVATDIPDASGPTTIVVNAGQTKDYELSVHARCSGASERTISFTNKSDGSYIWYKVQLKISPPPPENTIKISTSVREPVEVELSLANPLEHPVDYAVKITGDGLSGPDKITVAGLKEETYTLLFNPMLSMRATGKLLFSNPSVGEFWYELKLDARDAPPVDLPEMSCALGSCCFQLIPLSNPLTQPIVLNLSLSNARDYQLVYPPAKLQNIMRGACETLNARPSLQVTLQPHQSTSIQLLFWPSSLTEVRRGTVEVVSPDIGNFVFRMEGRGLHPAPFETVSLTSHLEEATSSLITFTNPLVDPVPLAISLEQPEGASDFMLIHQKQRRLHLGGLESVDIPFMYRPSAMRGQEARLVVQIEGTTLKWVFPVKGMPEYTLGSTPMVLETRAREAVAKDIELLLPRCAPVTSTSGASPPSISFRISAAETVLYGRSQESVDDETIQSLTLTLEQAKYESNGASIRFKATYNPPSPSTQVLRLTVVENNSSALWRIPLRLISHPPSLDDTITVEGTLNKVSYVSFVLKSNVAHDRQFRAYFAQKNDDHGRGEFVVLPKEGVLVPESRRRPGTGNDPGDNVIVVGYRAREYGKTVVGILMVECEDVSWSFEVRGVTPAVFTPGHPSIASSSRMSSARRHGPRKEKRNFIRENSLNPLLARSASAVDWNSKSIKV
ncbi:hypothetical protein BC832DRAFT_591190 [Gaertneriomyces semiglobifer]|nr:hypothetical protein BC832DRAFT_591190 [Gaertneriomyces semiglobifer]